MYANRMAWSSLGRGSKVSGAHPKLYKWCRGRASNPRPPDILSLDPIPSRLWVWRPNQARLPRLLFRIQYDFDLTFPYFIYAFWRIVVHPSRRHIRSRLPAALLSSQERSLSDVRDALMIDAVEFTARLQTYITVWRLENLLGLLIKIASFMEKLKEGLF